MLDHVTLCYENFEQAKDFYERALAPLGLKILMGQEGLYWGFGKDRPVFWIGAMDATHPASKGAHIAFATDTNSRVEAFYEAALAAGATDNGAPGYRNQYGSGYYAAFVIDPEGHNIEAVYYNPNL
jgi:catechol 2,3-dioxygenase-like lactoylglutathione lyase family enzyme